MWRGVRGVSLIAHFMAIKRAFSMQFPSMQVFKASPKKFLALFFLNGLQCAMLRLSLATGRKPIAKDKPPMSVGWQGKHIENYIYMRVWEYTC